MININKLNPLHKLIINIILSLYIIYLAFMILSNLKISVMNGLITALLGSVLLTISMYNYLNDVGEKEEDLINKLNKLRGLNFNKNDPKYKPIGGIGGSGWV